MLGYPILKRAMRSPVPRVNTCTVNNREFLVVIERWCSDTVGLFAIIALHHIAAYRAATYLQVLLLISRRLAAIVYAEGKGVWVVSSASALHSVERCIRKLTCILFRDIIFLFLVCSFVDSDIEKKFSTEKFWCLDEAIIFTRFLSYE